ncbi:MAG TPA: ATP-binding protein [Leptolyngbyaceae cyanobacterium]
MAKLSSTKKMQAMVRGEHNLDGLPIHLLTLGAEIGSVLLESRTLPETLQVCAETIAHYLDATNVCIWTFDEQTNLLNLAAFAGEKIYTASITKSTLLPSLELEEIKPKLIPVTYQVAPFKYRLYCLIVENHLLGAIALFGKQSLREAEDILLSWVANHIALGIDRIFAKKALCDRRDSLLLHLASQLRQSLDFNTILETALQEVHKLLKIDRCHFLWYFPNAIEPRITITHEVQNGSFPSLMGDFPAPQSNIILHQISNLEIMRIDEVATAFDLDEEIKQILTKFGITAQLLLPFKTHTGQYGAIVCSHCQGARPWSDSEVEFLQGVCEQVAVAIDQAEFYAQTRASALAAQTQAQHLSAVLYKLQQAQSQLVQQEKMSSLGQMIAGIAHEINNPVNFINGNLIHAEDYIKDLLELLDIYQECYPNAVPNIQNYIADIDLEFIREDLPKLLSSMQMGTERIRQIVLSLRNFSRLDEAEMKPVDIHEGIDSTLLILHNRLKASGHDPGVEIIKEYGNLPLVECYAGQLNQVFMNIIVNAIDALENQSPPRIIKIHTELISQPKMQGDRVLISITDNGSGMKEAVKNRLFDPFFTTKPVGKGTGLGLSISYQIIVEKHRGTIKCNSELGKGSEFAIEIPVSRNGISG